MLAGLEALSSLAGPKATRYVTRGFADGEDWVRVMDVPTPALFITGRVNFSIFFLNIF